MILPFLRNPSCLFSPWHLACLLIPTEEQEDAGNSYYQPLSSFFAGLAKKGTVSSLTEFHVTKSSQPSCTLSRLITGSIEVIENEVPGQSRVVAYEGEKGVRSSEFHCLSMTPGGTYPRTGHSFLTSWQRYRLERTAPRRVH